MFHISFLHPRTHTHSHRPISSGVNESEEYSLREEVMKKKKRTTQMRKSKQNETKNSHKE